MAFLSPEMVKIIMPHKKRKKVKILIIIIGLLTFGCNSRENKSTDKKEEKVFQIEKESKDVELKNGDLIFHTSQSSQSQAIQIATNSKYSHMGII